MIKKIVTVFIIGMGLAGSLLAKPFPQLTADNIDEVVAAMTLEEKARLVNGIGTFWSGEVRSLRDIPGGPGGTYAIPRLGVPGLYFGDGPLGLRINETREFDNHKYSVTAEPCPLLVGSSWDPELIYEIAQDIGEECREYGIDVMLGPSFNLLRHPMGGRTHEYYSEDPYLSGVLAGYFTEGVQSVGVGASVKHFAANNQESNRQAVNTNVSQRALRELYLKPFEISLGICEPWTVMTSYNGLNGKWTAENRELIEDVLRGDWGFTGMVMTDWGGGKHPERMVAAGNDLLEPGRESHIQAIIKAVEEGRLDVEDLDTNCKRILQMVVKTHSYAGYKFSNRPDMASHQALARRAGAEGTILLKNEAKTLPFAENIKNVALYGNTAYNLIPGGIGPMEYNTGNYTISLVEGLRLAGYEVDYKLLKSRPRFNRPSMMDIAMGRTIEETPEFVPSAEALAEQAKSDDVAIIVFGHIAGESSDRTIKDFYLTDLEHELLDKVSAAYHAEGKKVVVILNIPGPIEMESWKDEADAILCAYQGGEQFGNWLADVLKGAVNPSGKLTVSFAKDLYDYPSSRNYPLLETKYTPSGMAPGLEGVEVKDEMSNEGERNTSYVIYEEGIYVGYRYFDSFGVDVTYPFGYGLSYTTFEYSEPTIKAGEDGFEVSVSIRNTGEYAGKEVAQLYVAAPKSSLEKPNKELKGFAKTKLLQPGESETLTMNVSIEDLASFNTAKSRWETSKGKYRFIVGASATDIKGSVTGTVKKMFTKEVRNVLKPEIEINELKRK